MRVWALAALVVAALTASRVHAHGCGQFRGPPGEVPPGLREPTDPDPPPPPPPYAGWKSWEAWWFENREPILQRKARLLADPSFEFGPGAPPSALRIRRLERARDRAILPVLTRLLLDTATPATIRVALLRSLGRCGGAREAAMLIAAVQADTLPTGMRHTALVALGRVRVENSAPVRACVWRVLRDSMRPSQDRVAAALVLGIHANAQTSGELRFLLDSVPLPRDVSQAVIVALGVIGDPTSRRPLESLARGLPVRGRLPDPELRACAAQALGRLGSNCSIPLLVELLGPNRAPDQVAGAIALALGSYPQAEHAVPILRELALSHAKRPRVAHCAMMALARFDHPEVVPTLTAVVANGEWGAREIAALALGMRVARQYGRGNVRTDELSSIHAALRAATLRDRGVWPLSRALARDPQVRGELEDLLVLCTCHKKFARYLAEAAEILGSPRNSLIQILEARVRANPAAYSTISSSRALASFGKSEVAPLLREPFLETYDRKNIRAPLDAAGYAMDPRSIPFLIEVLLDIRRSPEQRAAAADALGRIGDVRPLDPFVRLRLRSPFPVNFLGLYKRAWN